MGEGSGQRGRRFQHWRHFQRFLGVDGFAAFFRQINNLVQQQYETGQVQYIPTIARALSADVPLAAMPNDEAFSYCDRTSRSDAPHWSNQMAASSFGPYFIYNAIAQTPLVAPAPLLIVHGTRDLFLGFENGALRDDARPEAARAIAEVILAKLCEPFAAVLPSFSPMQRSAGCRSPGGVHCRRPAGCGRRAP